MLLLFRNYPFDYKPKNCDFFSEYPNFKKNSEKVLTFEKLCFIIILTPFYHLILILSSTNFRKVRGIML